uniref:Uncharacterized protein n=1 Tax=Rhizophora mucronata TaxID=61149 RepID=A0A2P2QGU6_RHIMU
MGPRAKKTFYFAIYFLSVLFLDNWVRAGKSLKPVKIPPLKSYSRWKATKNGRYILLTFSILFCIFFFFIY